MQRAHGVPHGGPSRASAAHALLCTCALLLSPAARAEESASYLQWSAAPGQGASTGRSTSHEILQAVEELASPEEGSTSFSVRCGVLGAVPSPSAVTDLGVYYRSSTTVGLQWTAPAADEEHGAGSVSAYIVRYSTTGPISSELDFSTATEYSHSIAPLPPSSLEKHLLTGLIENTTHWFVLVSANPDGHWFVLVSANPDGVLSERSVQASTVTFGYDSPPADITNLTAVAGVSDGVIELSWTEPGDDGYSGTAASYTVRVSTSRNMESLADFLDPSLARGLDAFSGTPLPSPGAGGGARVLSVTGLTPGVTFYFAMRATDRALPDPNTADWVRDPGAGRNASNWAVATDLAPSSPTALSVSVGTWSLTLSWDANPEFDIAYYRVWRCSTTPAGNFLAYTTTTANSFTDTGLAAYNSYYYRVSAVDTGPLVLEGGLTPWATGMPMSPPLPMAPFGVRLEAATPGVTLRWLGVRSFEDRTYFASLVDATPLELTGYRVYRATEVTRSSWTELAVLSSTTLSYTDPGGGPGYHYHVRAENLYGLSAMSMVRSGDGRTGWIVGADGLSSLELGPGCLPPLMGDGADPGSAYRISPSSGAPVSDSRVLKWVGFDMYKGEALRVRDVSLGAPAVLHLHFAQQGGLIVAEGLTAAAAPSALASPENVSMYWNNGSRWVQVFGKVDMARQESRIETTFAGDYQLRSSERAQGFSFDKASVSNSFVTPNGDGLNDEAVFVYNNPRDSEVSGAVFDRYGAYVCAMTAGPFSNSLLWDGKSNGKAVPGGVYIYQLKAEGQTYSGTLVVIR